VLTRRRFLAVSGATAGLALEPRLGRAATGSDGFTVLRAKGGVAPLLGDTGDPTAIWGYKGQSPGPILRVRQGEELKVRLVNDLLEPTSIHWYGVRLPNPMDGTALTQEPVQPGDSFDYVFTPPDAGTFWYHAYIGLAGQVDRGLYGALIVEEASPPDPIDPMNDVVLVIDDWWLTESGAINEDAFGDMSVAAQGGRMGNWLTVNGVSRPTLAAPASQRLRIRLINAANARIMRLLFPVADPQLLALDGQPLAEPRSLTEALVLPPGGRADLGLPRGPDRVILAIEIDGTMHDLALIDRQEASRPEDQAQLEDGPAAGDGAESGDPDTAPPKRRIEAKVVSIHDIEGQPYAKREAEAGFTALPANPLPASLDMSAAVAVGMVMEGGANGGMESAVVAGERMKPHELVEHGMVWAINGVAGVAEEPLVSVARGRTVALAVDNKTDWQHALHLHGHAVRVVEDGTIDPDWRDTVLIEPHQTVTLAFLADNPGKWIVECHVLEHGEAGMMTWIEVT
jgi:FtsP/CotA-like multicopper oxidase with cupredoxin domain